MTAGGWYQRGLLRERRYRRGSPAAASAYSVLAPDAVAQEGVLTGFTVTTNAADMAIVSMMIQDSIAGYRG